MTTMITDDTFGPCYLTPSEFQQNAAMFGVSPINDDLCQNLPAYLAAASRWVEKYTGKTFIPNEDIVEQHRWDPATRRVPVNNPPILSVSKFKVYTGPNTFATIPVTELLINNQSNWVEVATIVLAFDVTLAALPMGLFEAIVEITYKSVASIEANIKLATGYVAGAMAAHAKLTGIMPYGVDSIKLGTTMAVTRTNLKSQTPTIPVPDIVSLLLADDVQLGIA
jgi:hypothetical protein